MRCREGFSSPDKFCVLQAGHKGLCQFDTPEREGLSVRYSRDDVGCRDSLGDVPVIFVIRPAPGCVDTGRRQHRRSALLGGRTGGSTP
jgi:hypothetical protein